MRSKLGEVYVPQTTLLRTPPPGQFLFGNKNLENVLSFCCQKKLARGGP